MDRFKSGKKWTLPNKKGIDVFSTLYLFVCRLFVFLFDGVEKCANDFTFTNVVRVHFPKKNMVLHHYSNTINTLRNYRVQVQTSDIPCSLV